MKVKILKLKKLFILLINYSKKYFKLFADSFKYRKKYTTLLVINFTN